MLLCSLSNSRGVSFTLTSLVVSLTIGYHSSFLNGYSTLRVSLYLYDISYCSKTVSRSSLFSSIEISFDTNN